MCRAHKKIWTNSEHVAKQEYWEFKIEAASRLTVKPTRKKTHFKNRTFPPILQLNSGKSKTMRYQQRFIQLSRSKLCESEEPLFHFQVKCHRRLSPYRSSLQICLYICFLFYFTHSRAAIMQLSDLWNIHCTWRIGRSSSCWLMYGYCQPWYHLRQYCWAGTQLKML